MGHVLLGGQIKRRKQNEVIIDNQSVVDGLKRRVKNLTKHPNGDIWTLLYRIIDQKNLTVVPVKAKSHVTTPV